MQSAIVDLVRSAILTLWIANSLLVSCWAQAVATGPVLKTARRHPMQYYLSFPEGWTALKKWPIVVTADGSNKEWLKNARWFAKARDERRYPFLIVTPLILTNGGPDLRHSPAYQYNPAVWDEVESTGRCAFDISGLQAVVADVQELYGGGSKYFMTGWSAGAHLTWAMVFQHPEQLLAAAPACGSYVGRCINIEVDEPVEVSSAPERIQLPVKAFQGEKDPLRDGLEMQSARAFEVAAAHGYRNCTRTIVPDVGHFPMPDQVLSYFNGLLRPDQER